MPEPLRILMIHNRYLIRGGEDASTDVSVDLLRAAGHEVHFLEDSNERVDNLGVARASFLERFSGEKILSSWVDLYRELSSARAGQGS